MKPEELFKKFDLMQRVMLATTDGSKAFVRPVIMVYHKSRFFIATGSVDDKCSQIKQNPSVEVCWFIDSKEKGHYIRLNSKAVFITELQLRHEIMEIASYIKNYWDNPADEGYALLEILPDYAAFMPYGKNLETKIDLR